MQDFEAFMSEAFQKYIAQNQEKKTKTKAAPRNAKNVRKNVQKMTTAECLNDHLLPRFRSKGPWATDELRYEINCTSRILQDSLQKMRRSGLIEKIAPRLYDVPDPHKRGELPDELPYRKAGKFRKSSLAEYLEVIETFHESGEIFSVTSITKALKERGAGGSREHISRTLAVGCILGDLWERVTVGGRAKASQYRTINGASFKEAIARAKLYDEDSNRRLEADGL